MRKGNFQLPMFVLAGALAFGVQPVGSQTIPEKIQPERKAPGATQPDRGGAPGTEGSPEAMHHDSAKIRAAQQALQQKGFDPGEINGVMSPQTQEALKSFQKANGLKVTGQLDVETTQKLGVEKSPAPLPGGSGGALSPSGPAGTGSSGGAAGKDSSKGLGR